MAAEDHMSAPSALTLLVIGALATSCTAWHTIPLQPQRFSAGRSPERARLTFNDGAHLTTSHPVLVGDSLVWANETTAESPPDSARSAVLASSIQRVEVNRVDVVPTVVLLGAVGGLVYAVLHALHNLSVAN
jgi:hypothetical protein